MKNIGLFLLFGCILLVACNEYEVVEPRVKVQIHVDDSDSNLAFEGYTGVIRSSDFSLSTSSTFFFENEESVLVDSSIINSNNDLAFEIPFVGGVPQKYYELSLFNSSGIPRTEGRFLRNYSQVDTFRIDALTQLDVKIRNDSCRQISFSTLGYRSTIDYKRDSARFFKVPDYITRIGVIDTKDTIISRILPFNCSKVVVLQTIDRAVSPPLLIKYEVLEMEKDSTKVHCVTL